MAKINATFEVGNRELLGVDTCASCTFKQFILDNRPCRCRIFNKELEAYNPLNIDIPHWEHKRLKECIDSEIND